MGDEFGKDATEVAEKAIGWKMKEMRPVDERVYRQFDARMFDAALADNLTISSFVLGITKVFGDQLIALEGLKKALGWWVVASTHASVETMVQSRHKKLVEFVGLYKWPRLMLDADWALKGAGGSIHVHGMFMHWKNRDRSGLEGPPAHSTFFVKHPALTMEVKKGGKKVTTQIIAKGGTADCFVLLWLLETLAVLKTKVSKSQLGVETLDTVIKGSLKAIKKETTDTQTVMVPAKKMVVAALRALKANGCVKEEFDVEKDFDKLFSWTKEVAVRKLGTLRPHACEINGARVPVRSWADVDRYRGKASKWFVRRSKPVITFLYHWSKSEQTGYKSDSVLASSAVITQYRAVGIPLETSTRFINRASAAERAEILIAVHSFMRELEANKARAATFGVVDMFAPIKEKDRGGRSVRKTLKLSRSAALLLTGKRDPEPVYHLHWEKPKKVVQL